MCQVCCKNGCESTVNPWILHEVRCGGPLRRSRSGRFCYGRGHDAECCMQKRCRSAGDPINQGRLTPSDVTKKSAAQSAEQSDCAAEKNQSHVMPTWLRECGAFCTAVPDLLARNLAGNGEEKVKRIRKNCGNQRALIIRAMLATRAVRAAHVAIQPKNHA